MGFSTVSPEELAGISGIHDFFGKARCFADKTDEGRALHITFTVRQSASLIRVISARGMHRKERAIYEQAD